MDDLDPKELLAQGVWLRRLARALTGDAHADDVLQETYAAALVSPPQSGQPLRPWLAAVLRNFAHMMFRGERRRRVREASVGAAVTSLPSPEELLAIVLRGLVGNGEVRPLGGWCQAAPVAVAGCRGSSLRHGSVRRLTPAS